MNGNGVLHTSIDEGSVAEIHRQLHACFTKPLTRSQEDTSFVLKLKGMLITGKVDHQARKRSHEDACATTSHGNVTEPSFPGSASVAHGILKEVFTELAQLASRTPSALRLSGVELRSLKLTASNLHMVDDDSHSAQGLAPPPVGTLSALLFSPQMPWQPTAPPSFNEGLQPTFPRTAALASLTMLDLESNPLGDDGIQVLCEVLLPRLPNLARLHLASTETTATGLSVLVHALCGDSATTTSEAAAAPPLCPSLAVVGLTNNPLHVSEEAKTGNVTVGALLARLATARCRTLERIHLNHAGLTTSDAAELLWAVATFPGGFPRLDMLYLKQNKAIDVAALKGALTAWASRMGQDTGLPPRMERLLTSHVLW